MSAMDIVWGNDDHRDTIYLSLCGVTLTAKWSQIAVEQTYFLAPDRKWNPTSLGSFHNSSIVSDIISWVSKGNEKYKIIT